MDITKVYIVKCKTLEQRWSLLKILENYGYKDFFYGLVINDFFNFSNTDIHVYPIDMYYTKTSKEWNPIEGEIVISFDEFSNFF